jgi:hypothetical protein
MAIRRDSPSNPARSLASGERAKGLPSLTNLLLRAAEVDAEDLKRLHLQFAARRRRPVHHLRSVCLMQAGVVVPILVWLPTYLEQARATGDLQAHVADHVFLARVVHEENERLKQVLNPVKPTIDQAVGYAKTLERINSVGMAMQILDTMADGAAADDLKSVTKAKLAQALIERYGYQWLRSDFARSSPLRDGKACSPSFLLNHLLSPVTMCRRACVPA